VGLDSLTDLAFFFFFFWGGGVRLNGAWTLAVGHPGNSETPFNRDWGDCLSQPLGSTTP